MKMDDGLNDGWNILGAILWDIPYESNYVDADISHRLSYCRVKDPGGHFNLLLANRVILHSEYPVLTPLYDDKGLEMPREGLYPRRGFYPEEVTDDGTFTRDGKYTGDGKSDSTGKLTGQNA